MALCWWIYICHTPWWIFCQYLRDRNTDVDRGQLLALSLQIDVKCFVPERTLIVN